MEHDNGELPDGLFDPSENDGEPSSSAASQPQPLYNRRVTRLRDLILSQLGGRLVLALHATKRALRQRRVQAGIGVASVLLLALGIVLIVAGSTAHKNPPTAPSPNAAEAIIQTPTEQLTTSVAPSPSRARTSPAPDPLMTTTGSIPIRITVPAIGVDANIMQLGLNADNTVQVPPLSEVRTAGWYKYSSTPGEPGPSVILGHIDSAKYGLGVFFELGNVRHGDIVTVLRADHMLATFSVTSVAEYPKTAFPTLKVYGNTAGPTLRLVTCGGRFNPATRSYLDNIVVYGDLVSLVHT